MQTRISGIPARIEVTSYIPWRPARLYGHPDSWAPAEGEIEWEVLDRRGRPAPWLARKLSPADRRDIEKDLIAQCTNREEDY
ncbi:MAG: hypothetical protein KAX46_13060 [Chromatiaceae bacterium]|nr:hypothetical protein [Chromatiaceae bacterium]